MPKPQQNPDALVDPFRPELHGKSERSLLSGEAFTAEATRFWTHRCQAYASYFDKLAKCGTFADVARLQTVFWTDLQRDYANESATFMSTATLTSLPQFARTYTPLKAPMPEQDAKAH